MEELSSCSLLFSGGMSSISCLSRTRVALSGNLGNPYLHLSSYFSRVLFNDDNFSRDAYFLRHDLIFFDRNSLARLMGDCLDKNFTIYCMAIRLLESFLRIHVLMSRCRCFFFLSNFSKLICI